MIQLHILLKRPPTTVTNPPELVYKEPVKTHTRETERDRKIRNQQLKATWQNRCKKIDEIGILCDDKPWEHCDQKEAWLLYLCIGTEGHRVFKSKNPHFLIKKESTKELRRVMEEFFMKTRNITYYRFVFFSSKQQKGDSVESFYGRLIEQAAKL